MTIDVDQLANILEASMLVAGKPMSLGQMDSLFDHETEKPSREEIRSALEQLQLHYQNRGIELVEVASGFRLQACQSLAPWITHLFQEKSPRYSRALMETLVLIAYRQPITRGEIEDVRGVAVSTNIIKTLLEREWVRVLGHRDVPGRPAILGTTRQFLDYFNLKRIDELPTLSEIKDLDQIDPDLAKEMALLESEAAASAEPPSAEHQNEENAEAGDSGDSTVEAANNEQDEKDDSDKTITTTIDLNLGEESQADQPDDDSASVAEPPADAGVNESNVDVAQIQPEAEGYPDPDATSHEPHSMTNIGESETLH